MHFFEIDPAYKIIEPGKKGSKVHFTDIELEYTQRSIVYGRVPTTTNKCEVTGLRQTLLTNVVKWTTPGEDPISNTAWTSPILTLTQGLTDYTKDKVCTMMFKQVEILVVPSARERSIKSHA